MELLFVTLGGAILGLGARYFLPHRHAHGSMLVPAAGAALAAILWVALTWAGLAWNGGWIWWITLVVTGLVVIALDLVIGRIRTRSDATLLATLIKTGVPARG